MSYGNSAGDHWQAIGRARPAPVGTPLTVDPCVALQPAGHYLDRMKTNLIDRGVVWLVLLGCCLAGRAQETAALPKAFIDGNGPDWKALGEADLVNVNCADDTWTFKDGGIQCTGKPTGVIRTKDPLTNFELVIEWKHLKSAGNSGVFLWGTKESLDALKPGGLPM